MDQLEPVPPNNNNNNMGVQPQDIAMAQNNVNFPIEEEAPEGAPQQLGRQIRPETAVVGRQYYFKTQHEGIVRATVLEIFAPEGPINMNNDIVNIFVRLDEAGTHLPQGTEMTVSFYYGQHRHLSDKIYTIGAEPQAGGRRRRSRRRRSSRKQRRSRRN